MRKVVLALGMVFLAVVGGMMFAAVTIVAMVIAGGLA